MTGKRIWVFICSDCMLKRMLSTFLQGVLKKKYTKEYGTCKYCKSPTKLKAEIFT